MLSSAVTTVLVVLFVLGATVGGSGTAWSGEAPGAAERAVGLPAGPPSAPFASGSWGALAPGARLQEAPASVTFEDQTSDGRTVTVAAATLPRGGFVTIHDESLVDGATFESVRGTSAYLVPGSHEGITVELDDPISETQRLVAVLYRDSNGNRVYDFVSSEGEADGPYESSRGGAVLDVATVTVAEPNDPPTAALQYSPIDPRPGEPVVFDGVDSDDPDGRVVLYSWRVRSTDPPLLVSFESDDTTVFEYAFETVGTYEVQLTVTDDDRARGATTTTVVVRENTPPRAAFEFTPVDPAPGDVVGFDATVSSDDRRVVSYLWDFDGDGRFEARGSRATRSFPEVGRYPVTLLVSDGEGETDRTSLTVSVVEENVPPVAAFDVSPGAPLAGEPVAFDASASFDPDGDAVVFYEWAIDGEFVAGDDAPRFSHTFPAPGVYDVTLTVTDGREAIGRATERVVVGEATLPPTAVLEFSPAVPNVDESVTFDATGSTDDGEILAYRWDLDGDGRFEATGPVVERRYASGGTFVASLLVIDDGGETDTANATVRVNEPPAPAFLVEPATPRVGESVTLDASGSSDDRRIVRYAWDLDGDGVFETTGRVVRHEFETPGDRIVRLAVTDDDGVRVGTTRTVGVGEVPDGESTTPTGTSTDGTGDDTPASSDTSTPAGPADEAGPSVPISPGGAAVVGGAAVAVVLVALFRDELAVLLRGLHLPRRLPRPTPRPGGRTRPVLDVPETDDPDDDEPNQPPTAAVRYVPAEPVAGRPVRFDGFPSTDPDGRVVSYRWSLGEEVDRPGPTIVHTFEEAGEYDVTLTVTDDGGATGAETVTVEVEGGEGELALVDVHPDAPGRKHLQQEYLVFGNVGDGPLDVTGWTVHDAAEEAGRTVREGDHAFTFGDVPELAPEATLTLHTGEDSPGSPGDREDEYHRYWGRTWFAVWNDDADVVVVKDDLDNPVLAARYRRTGDGYAIEPLDPERFGDLFPEFE